MTVADIDEVMAIEKAAFASPWSRQFFLEELRATHARSVLCQRDGKPIGYVIYWELPGELDIHNVAVHPRFAGVRESRAPCSPTSSRGATKRGFPAHDARSPQVQRPGADPVPFASVSRSAVCARGYYSDNGEDAWVMERKLAPSRNEPLQELSLKIK